MAVRDARLRVRILDELHVGPRMPKREWEDAHEGAVPVCALVGRSGIRGRHARAQRPERDGRNVNNFLRSCSLRGAFPFS
jgi:hypothetical protein